MGLTYRARPGGVVLTIRVRMGRNAASVLPEAVFAEMIRSRLPSRSRGAARSCASRKSVQPCSHIHFWISGCNRSKATDGLDFEGGELISGFGCSQTIQCGRHVIGLHLDLADQGLPVGASVLIEHGEKVDKRG